MTLKKKYMAVAATKIDAADQGMLDSLTAYCRENGYPFFPISAVSGAGLEPLLRFLSDRVEEERENRGSQKAEARSQKTEDSEVRSQRPEVRSLMVAAGFSLRTQLTDEEQSH